MADTPEGITTADSDKQFNKFYVTLALNSYTYG
jgi:hypothetical protein